MARRRRKYALGNCDDCGWRKRVTRVIFWVNGFTQNYCAECIKPYRGVILKPCAASCAHD